MNSTSPAATGTVGVVIAAIVVLIDAANRYFHFSLTPQDEVSIAGGIVAAVHWLAEQYAARQGKPEPCVTFASIAAPAQPTVAVPAAPAQPTQP